MKIGLKKSGTIVMLGLVLALSSLANSNVMANDASSYQKEEPQKMYIPNMPLTRGMSSSQGEIIITNKDEISKYIELNDIIVPNGEELVKIEITRTNAPTDTISTVVSNPSNRATSYSVKNINTLSGDYTYASDKVVDKVSNMSTTQTDKYSTTYSQTKSSDWSVGAKATGTIKVVELEGAVGFSCAKSVTNQKSFEASIPPQKRIEVSVNTNYMMKTYDVYNGNTKLDSGKAWKPLGLIIVKYEYKI